MSRLFPFFRFVTTAALVLFLAAWIPAAAQAQEAERTFPHSQDAVEKALAQIRPTAKGRLPTLDGFVGTTDQPLERYRSGYYECSIKVSPGSPSGTLVRVTAKVTAWYTDSNPARSGYRTLPSNGRLEADLLDRLAEILDPSGSQAAGAPATGPLSPSPSPSVPSGAFRPPSSEFPYRPAPSGERTAPLPASGAAGRAESAGTAAAPGSESASTDAQRAQAEQHASELHNLAQNLEEILRNQSHPNNLAAVRKSGTPVYAKPFSTSQILFSAEAEDEFQIMEVQSAWVHVQISGVSRGWIRRAQLEMPEGFAESPAKTGDSTSAGGASFRMTRETVTRFPGDWQPLRGKMVKVFYVEPTAGMATSAKEKLAFAKSLLTSAFPDSTPGADSAAGVVVVFDAADGGQISVTLADLKQLQQGQISEVVFWHRCSLDPRESFEDTDKR